MQSFLLIFHHFFFLSSVSLSRLFLFIINSWLFVTESCVYHFLATFSVECPSIIKVNSVKKNLKSCFQRNLNSHPISREFVIYRQSLNQFGQGNYVQTVHNCTIILLRYLPKSLYFINLLLLSRNSLRLLEF